MTGNVQQLARASQRPRALIHLPPLPAVAMKLLQLLFRDDVGIKGLCDLIRADPALSGEILKLANSPLFPFRTEIKSVVQAAVLLGLRRVKALAVTVGMRVYLTDLLKIPALLACWRHSLACALVAEELARVSQIDRDEAYTAGIMHDVGRLALAVIHPLPYANFLASTEGTPSDTLERERELFDMDHCQAGRWLVEAWKLPKDFADITARHHAEPSGNRFDRLALIRISCMLADALGFAATKPLQRRTFEEVLSELPVRERSRFEPDPDQLTLRVATRINAMEQAVAT